MVRLYLKRYLTILWTFGIKFLVTFGSKLIMEFVMEPVLIIVIRTFSL